MSRILITGVSSRWGGALAQTLERDPAVEAIIGIDTEDPRHELQRTEFVRVDAQPALIRRILAAAAIDTVVDTRLITDPLAGPLARAHEVNVEATAAMASRKTCRLSVLPTNPLGRSFNVSRIKLWLLVPE